MKQNVLLGYFTALNLLLLGCSDARPEFVDREAPRAAIVAQGVKDRGVDSTAKSVDSTIEVQVKDDPSSSTSVEAPSQSPSEDKARGSVDKASSSAEPTVGTPSTGSSEPNPGIVSSGPSPEPASNPAAAEAPSPAGTPSSGTPQEASAAAPAPQDSPSDSSASAPKDGPAGETVSDIDKGAPVDIEVSDIDKGAPVPIAELPKIPPPSTAASGAVVAASNATTMVVDSDVSEDEKLLCSKWLDIPAERLKIAGSKQKLVINASEALVIKMSGHNNSAELKLSGESAKSFPGICVIQRGNKNLIKINISQATVHRLVYDGAGNQNKAIVNVGAGAVIADVVSRVQGNGSNMQIVGEGTYP